MFRESFKYYKARKTPPDLSNVIDIRNNVGKLFKRISVVSTLNHDTEQLGLKPMDQWKAYELLNIHAAGQKNWIVKSLKNYTMKPNKLNVDAHNLLPNGKHWWNECVNQLPKKDLFEKLRWATLGYHYNWTTKQYSENEKSEMPADLCKITKLFANCLGFNEFKAESAIINYYRMDSTLSGHVDQSELFLEAPLISISFGQKAIFLIGGLTKENTADALYLRSGDIMIMSGDSRLRYHGIPRIVPDEEIPWKSHNPDNNLDEDDWRKAKSYIDELRINLTVRQVLKPGISNFS